MHIKLTNGKPENYSIGQLRRDNPQTSFPKHLSDELLEEYGVFAVNRLPHPNYNPLTHYLKQSDFYQVDGQWQVHYYPEPLPVATQIENLQAARSAAYKEEADPLFFKAQRGEININEWDNKVQEIRNRYPYPEQAE